ncbi:glyceraldehyde-3-phosphate dehydrogenase [Kocuria soli]|uniref:Glyceraldehyde-3-phosphate dehydrogenase n=1 Tax=Kocuria soli TaxID=2485125 RepID=A0A3N3ZVQ7_9MICC|nr:glyceraldehyde-3-phosphate dehydrogenase [Kocuria soli]ROZ64308.1 glyceraldehyde-3-phosphate dehydrogenase [Kocuria soli]
MSAVETWAERETRAEAMVPVIGRLYRENKVVLNIHGRSLVHKSVTDILKAHRFARRVVGEELTTARTWELLTVLQNLDLGTCQIDLGKMAAGLDESKRDDVEQYLREQLAPVVGQQGQNTPQTRDVVLYGFGRIGRLLARILVERYDGTGLNLRAVVVRKKPGNDLVKRASLLRRDSIHGKFNGSILVDEERNVISANGVDIQVIYADSPESVDYRSHGIDDAILIDNTGVWRDVDGLSRHLEAPGISKVLLTAPGKGEMKNIVCGVNDADIDPADQILSAASCTTNAITPVVKVLNDKYGIQQGHVETVHAFTNDQNLTDNYHKGSRRGRAAGLNMVITETGAAKAVAKALPEMEGKLTGNAIRVPVPDVSMAVLTLQLDQAPADAEELNQFLRGISLDSPYSRQIDFTDSPETVSSDLVGSRYACVVDGLATVVNNNTVVVYAWYDNEFGYSNQVVRVCAKMADIAQPKFPSNWTHAAQLPSN